MVFVPQCSRGTGYRMKKGTKIVIITIVLFILMGCYKPLIGIFISDKYLATFLQKLLKAVTVIIYITKLKFWDEIGSIKKLSNSNLLLLLPVAVLSLIPVLNGIKIKSISIIFIILATVILIGIVEELLFRGVIFTALKENGTINAILISSFIFALTHFLNLVYGADFLDTVVQVVFAFGFGLVMAVVRSKTNILLPLILVHALWDFVLDISNTNFNGTIDTIHSISLVLVLLWGIFLTFKVYKESSIMRG